MTERCPHCGARNARVKSSVDCKGWEIEDDYCGRCGKNWKRPKVREEYNPFENREEPQS